MSEQGIVDVNVTLGRWPTRRLPLDETPALLAKLRGLGVTQAWAGSYDALLHRDLSAVNTRLVDECRRSGDFFVPLGCVNPMFPDWEEELRRCHEDHKMPGIRLFPNYHGYKLDHPDFARLLTLAADRGLIVQLPISMEDERAMHPLLNVPSVDPAPLRGLVKSIPKLRLVLLNALRTVRLPVLPQLFPSGVFFDIATQEGVGGVANLVKLISPDRILFGTGAPFFYPENAFLKMKESALPEDTARRIFGENARKLLSRP
jgi:predicted TIM-barrel fold metal-dependent hydrolase